MLGGWLGEGASDACDASSESSESYEDPESVMGQLSTVGRQPGLLTLIQFFKIKISFPAQQQHSGTARIWI